VTLYLRKLLVLLTPWPLQRKARPEHDDVVKASSRSLMAAQTSLACASIPPALDLSSLDRNVCLRLRNPWLRCWFLGLALAILYERAGSHARPGGGRTVGPAAL